MHFSKLSGIVLASLLFLSAGAHAQQLMQDAGTIEVRLRAVTVIPEVNSSISPIGGHAKSTPTKFPSSTAPIS